MPVPEIDRLAHEILDILGSNLADGQAPDEPWTILECALVSVARQVSEVYAPRKPLNRGESERLHACRLRLQELATVGDDPPGEFQASPVPAFLRLYAALERAEMQERATPTPNLATNQKPLLPLTGDSCHDMRRHQEGEGTR